VVGKQAVSSRIVVCGKLDKDRGQVTAGRVKRGSREVNSVAPVSLGDNVDGSALHAIHFGEELEVRNPSLRWARRGSWVQDTGDDWGESFETSIREAEPICAFLYRQENACDAKNIIWSARSEVQVD